MDGGDATRYLGKLQQDTTPNTTTDTFLAILMQLSLYLTSSLDPNDPLCWPTQEKYCLRFRLRLHVP